MLYQPTILTCGAIIFNIAHEYEIYQANFNFLYIKKNENIYLLPF